MQFDAPDPQRYRMSDCGRYIIERFVCGGKPYYCVWQYTTQRGGYDSFDDAKEAIMTREFHRFDSAADVGSVGYCQACGHPDAVALPARRALEGDIF